MAQEVTAPGPAHTIVTIPAGKALSEPWTIKGKVVGIYMPGGWDAADITFLASPDKGTDGVPIVDDGVERAIPSAQAQPNRLIALDYGDWLCVNTIRIRSGTAGAPVNQTVERKLVIVLAG